MKKEIKEKILNALGGITDKGKKSKKLKSAIEKVAKKLTPAIEKVEKKAAKKEKRIRKLAEAITKIQKEGAKSAAPVVAKPAVKE